MAALGREPVLEAGGTGHREALEELARNQGDGAIPGALAGPVVQLIGVEADGAVGQPNLAAGAVDRVLSSGAANHAQRFVQGVPRGAFLLLSPQQSSEMLASAGAAGRAGEIHQQG